MWAFLSTTRALSFVSEKALLLVTASEYLWNSITGGRSPSWSPVPDGVSPGKGFPVRRVYSGRNGAGGLKLLREEWLEVNCACAEGSLATTLKE